MGWMKHSIASRICMGTFHSLLTLAECTYFSLRYVGRTFLYPMGRFIFQVPGIFVLKIERSKKLNT